MPAPGDRDVVAGVPVEIRLHATDPEGESVEYGGRGLPIGSRLLPEPDTGSAVFQWIPLASDAAPEGRPHVVTFIAQDPHGNRVEARVTLTVRADDTRPRFTSPRAFVLRPGETLDVVLAVRDDDSETVTYTLVSGPKGATLTPRPDGVRLTWTHAPAPESPGVVAFVVAAADETGEAGRVVQTFHAVLEP